MIQRAEVMHYDAPTYTPTTMAELQPLVAQWTECIPNIKTSSRRQYTKDITTFFEWVELTNRRYNMLTQVDIVRFQSYLEDKGLSPLTISAYLIALRKFFEWTQANKIYPNIAQGVKGPSRQKKFQKQALTDEQSRALLNYAEGTNARDYAIINLALRCGLRTIEVVRANVGDITYKGGRRILKVWGKGKVMGDKEEDFVILTDKAYEPIRAYLATRPNAKPYEPLFTTNKGPKRTEIEGRQVETSNADAKHGERLTTRTISQICKDALTAVGLTGHEYTAHSLRHTCGCTIIRHAGSLQDVQYVLRHSSSKTSEIYLESIKEEQRLQRAPESLLDAL